MTETRQEGRGGPGRGQGRKRGSTRPLWRRHIARRAYGFIEGIREQAEEEGRKCNPVTEAYVLTFASDHPDKVTIKGGRALGNLFEALINHETVNFRDLIKIIDEEHFARYCETQDKLRSRGVRELNTAFELEEARARRRRRV